MDRVLQERKRLIANDIKSHHEQMVKFNNKYAYYNNKKVSEKWLKKLEDNIKFQRELRDQLITQYELEFGKFEL